MTKLKFGRNVIISILAVFLMFTNIPAKIYAEENEPATETVMQEVVEEENTEEIEIEESVEEEPTDDQTEEISETIEEDFAEEETFEVEENSEETVEISEENIEDENTEQVEEQEEEPASSTVGIIETPMNGKVMAGLAYPSSLNLSTGNTGTFAITIMDSKYSITDFYSSDESVATVELDDDATHTYNVTGIGAGSATITVVLKNGDATSMVGVLVTVIELETPTFATKIEGVDVSEKELLDGTTASVTVETNSNGTISAASSDTSVVTVTLKNQSTHTYEICAKKVGTATVTFSMPSTESYNSASKEIAVTVNEKEVIETLNVTSVPTAYYTTSDNNNHIYGNFALADNSHATIDMEVYGYGYAIAVISAEAGYKFKIADSLQTSLTGKALDKVWTGKEFKESIDSGADVYDDNLLIGMDVPQNQLLIVRELKDMSMSYDKKTGIVTITGAKLTETSVEEYSENHTLLTGYDIMNDNAERVSEAIDMATEHSGDYIDYKQAEYEFSGDKNVCGDAGTTDGTAVIDLKDEALTYTSATYAWIFVYSNYIRLSSEPVYYFYGVQDVLLPSKVTFDLNGGNISSSTDNVMRYLKDGDAIDEDLIADPEKEGLTFVGWYDAASGGNKVTSFTGSNNVTYYAHYEDPLDTVREIEANITYDKKTGKVTVSGAKFDENAVTESGISYDLFSTYDILVDEGTDYTKYCVNKVTSHSSSNGTAWDYGDKPISGPVSKNKTGNYEVDLTQYTYSSGTALHLMVLSDRRTRQNPDKYPMYGYLYYLLPSKVTFNLNGGNIDSSTDNVMRYLKDGDAIDTDLIANPEKEGYTFVGWFYANGGNKVTSFTGSNNVTYYAHYVKDHNWTQIKESTLSATFDADLTEEEAIAIAEAELGTAANKIVYYKYDESEQCYKILYYNATSWIALDSTDLTGYLSSGAEAYAIGTTEEASVKIVVGSKTIYCATFEEAIAAVNAEETATITLLDDATIENQIFLKEGRNVTIDLNGKNLSADFKSSSASLFKIGNATLTITGEGTVYGGENANAVIFMFGSGDTSATDYSVFNLDEDAKLDHNKVGIRVYPPNKNTANDYGVKINIKGQITGSLDYPAIEVNASLVGTGDNIAQINIDGATIQGQLYLSGVSKTRLYNNPEISAMGKTIVVQNSDVTIENGSYYPSVPDGEDADPIAVYISQNATGTLNITGGNFYGTTESKTDTVNSFVTGGKFLSLDEKFVADGYGRKSISEAGLLKEVVAKVAADKVVFENAPEYWQTDVYDLMDKYELGEDSKGEIMGLMTISDGYQAYDNVYIHLSPSELYYFDANTKVEGLNGDNVSCVLVNDENISDLKLIYFEDLEVGDIFVIDKKLYRENTKDIEGISIDNDLKIHFANDEGYYFIEETNTDEQAEGLYDLYTSKPAYTYAYMKVEESELLGITTDDGDSLKAYTGRTIAVAHCSVYHYDQNEDIWIALIDGVSLVKVPKMDKIDDKDVSGGAKGEFYIKETNNLSAHISGISLADVKGTDDNGNSTDNYSGIVVWYDKNGNGRRDNGEVLTYGSDYTISQGSVVVTLTKSFLNTLSVGSYTILVEVTDKNQIAHEFEIPVVIKSKSVAANATYTVVNTSVEGTKNEDNGMINAIVAAGLFALLIALTKKRKDTQAD